MEPWVRDELLRDTDIVDCKGGQAKYIPAEATNWSILELTNEKHIPGGYPACKLVAAIACGTLHKSLHNAFDAVETRQQEVKRD